MPRHREIPREISAQDFQNALARLGVVRIAGDPPHVTLHNPVTGGTSTVGLHFGVPRRHVKAALRELGISEEAFLGAL